MLVKFWKNIQLQSDKAHNIDETTGNELFFDPEAEVFNSESIKRAQDYSIQYEVLRNHQNLQEFWSNPRRNRIPKKAAYSSKQSDPPPTHKIYSFNTMNVFSVGKSDITTFWGTKSFQYFMLSNKKQFYM